MPAVLLWIGWQAIFGGSGPDADGDAVTPGEPVPGMVGAPDVDPASSPIDSAEESNKSPYDGNKHVPD